MNTENLSELRVPELPSQTPEGLAPLLTKLERALSEDRPFVAARSLLDALDLLLRYFTGTATGLLKRLEPNRPEITALASNVDSILQYERLLRFSMSALEVHQQSRAQQTVRRVFFLNGKTTLPFAHARWLRLAGQSEGNLQELSHWAREVERLEATQDREEMRGDLRGYLEILRSWLEGAATFFETWKHNYERGEEPHTVELTLASAGEVITLLPPLPQRFGPALERTPLSLDLGEPAPAPAARPRAEWALDLPTRQMKVDPPSAPVEELTLELPNSDTVRPSTTSFGEFLDYSGLAARWSGVFSGDANFDAASLFEKLDKLGPAGRPLFESFLEAAGILDAFRNRLDSWLKKAAAAQVVNDFFDTIGTKPVTAGPPPPEFLAAYRHKEQADFELDLASDPEAELEEEPKSEPEQAAEVELVPAPVPPPETRPPSPELPSVRRAQEDLSLLEEQARVEGVAPWTRAEVEAFDDLLRKTYPPIDSELVPQDMVSTVRRFLNAQDRGYILVEGNQGTGKSLLCQALGQSVKTAQGDRLPILYFPIKARLQTDCQTFIEQLNEHIRVSPSLGRRAFEALDQHVIKHLNNRFGAEARAARFSAYLSELILINETSFVLCLDGLDEAFEGAGGQATLHDFLPEQLPEGVFVLATYRVDGLSARGTAKVDLLRAGSNLLIELDEQSEAYREVVRRHLTGCAPEMAELIIEKSEGRLATARHMAEFLAAGLLESPADLPAGESFYEAALELLEQRFGRRFLNLFLLLATSDEPVPTIELSTFGILRADALELLHNLPSLFHCFDREDPGLSLAHRSFKYHLQESYYTLYASVCERLARFALTEISSIADPLGEARMRLDRLSLTLRRLYSWVLDSQNSDLLSQVCEREELRRVRNAVFAELEDRGLFHRKTTILDGFRQSLAALVERYHRPGFREELAWAHSSRGLAYLHLGHSERALGDIEHAVHHFLILVEEEGQTKLRNGLAAAYNRRSEACRELGQVGPALTDAEQAVHHYTIVVEEQNREELKALLALAIHNRGLVHRARRELPDALEDFDRAVDYYARLVEIDRARRLRRELAQAHHSRSCLMLEMGDAELAVREATLGLDLFEQLVNEEDYESLRNDLAAVYNDRGAALHRLSNFEEAEKDYASAVAIRTYLVSEGRLDVRTDLATTYTNRGLVLYQEERFEEALENFDRAVEILNRLVDVELQEDLYPTRAFAFVCRGTLQRSQGRLARAADDYQSATGDYRLAVVSGDDGCLPELAMALSSLGACCLEMGDEPGAIRACSRALEIYEDEIGEERQDDFLHERAVAHNNLGQAHLEREVPQQAAEEFQVAVALYTRLVEEEGRIELASDLAACHLSQAELSFKLEEKETGIRAASRAIALYSGLEEEGSPLTTTGLAQALELRSQGYEQLGSTEAALDDLSRAADLFLKVVDYRDLAETARLADVLDRRGRLVAAVGSPAQSLDDFTRALEMYKRLSEDSNDPIWHERLSTALLHRAGALIETDAVDLAVRDLVEAFASGRLKGDQAKMATVSRLCKNLKLRALRELRKQDYQAAITLYGRLVELFSALAVQGNLEYQAELAQSYHYRGFARTRLEQVEAALDDFDKALELFRPLVLEKGLTEHTEMLARTFSSRGATLETLGFEEKALEEYGEAYDLFEVNDHTRGSLLSAQVLANRARLRARTGDTEGALEDFEQAGQLYQKQNKLLEAVECEQALASLLLELERVDEAQMVFGKAARVFAELDPTDSRLRTDWLRSLVHQAPDEIDLPRALALTQSLIATGGLPAEMEMLPRKLLERVVEAADHDHPGLDEILPATISVGLAIVDDAARKWVDYPDQFLKLGSKLSDTPHAHYRASCMVLAALFCQQEVERFGYASLPRLVRSLLLAGKTLRTSTPPEFLPRLGPSFSYLARTLGDFSPPQKLEVEINNTARLWQSLPASLVARAQVSRSILNQVRRW
ncbi:MAG: tetratricopeptide repeat protein [Vulcanimicrobiota bacterium]